MLRRSLLLFATLSAAACDSEETFAVVAVDDALRQPAPELIAALDAMPGLSLTNPGQSSAYMVLASHRAGAILEFDRMSVLFDRRDPAFADTIDLGAANIEALAALITTRILSADLAASTAEADNGRVDNLRAAAAMLPALITDANPNSPLGEDLRTSYRQALFQIASETRSKADVEAMTAFEKAEAKQELGVDGDDRYDRSRAWYYFASADHLRADLTVENEIAQAFSGFKD
ncbi:MAG: hypothetical protein HRU11_14565, partial [Parvularculaceae bacterium]|nr:hypothetical protein [Parvularculaceae bacterium]